MTTLNRNRYRIAELVERISEQAGRRTPEGAAADACRRAGLAHQVADRFVTVSARVEFMEFTAIEPAVYTSPSRTGWFVWWRRTDGIEVHRDGSVWCAGLAEAVEIAARWAA